MGKRNNKIKMLTLDTETYGLEGAIRRCAVYDGKQVYYGYNFSDIEPVLKNYKMLGYSVHVYIHNLEFDVRKIPDAFNKDKINWNGTKLISNKYVRIESRDYILHDSYRILTMSLAKLSGPKGFNVEHGKVDLWEQVCKKYPDQYKTIEEYFMLCDADDPLYIEYLGYDVISLYEVLEKVIELSGVGLGNFVRLMTTASLSRFIFKTGYHGEKFGGPEITDYERLTNFTGWQSEKIPTHCIGTETTYKEIEKMVREGYYGGRTEVFKPHLEKREGISGWHIDVNSLYPSRMIDNFYPIGAPSFCDEEQICHKWWTDWVEEKIGLGYIRASIYIPEQKIPPLPCKRGKLMFPTGYLTGTWTYTELLFSMERCGVKLLKIHHMIHFQKTYKVFHNFIKVFSEIKEKAAIEKNEALKTFSKLVMNVSYGYLCMNRDDKTELLNEAKYLENIQGEDKRHMAERFLGEDKNLGWVELQSLVEGTYIQPQTGAYVTSYARIFLLDMMLKLSEKGNVYYCDTDSIVCDTEPPAEALHATKLGYWGVENLLEEGIFIAPKVYAEMNTDKKLTVRFKGVSKSTQEKMDLPYFQALYKVWENGGKVRERIEEGKKGLYGIRNMQKQGRDLNTLRLQTKSMKIGSKQKRQMDFKNNTTTAWHFATEEDGETFDFREPIKPWSEFGNALNPIL